MSRTYIKFAFVCVKMIYHRFNTHEAPTRSKPLGSVPHLAYLSSLSLGGRAYSGLGWRIFSLSRFHPMRAITQCFIKFM
eukprot:COSAG02_NODE_1354_length_13100_cov_7.477040_10_plen_79_part_00